MLLWQWEGRGGEGLDRGVRGSRLGWRPSAILLLSLPLAYSSSSGTPTHLFASVPSL